jgi:hypothetical protein
VSSERILIAILELAGIDLAEVARGEITQSDSLPLWLTAR